MKIELFIFFYLITFPHSLSQHREDYTKFYVNNIKKRLMENPKVEKYAAEENEMGGPHTCWKK